MVRNSEGALAPFPHAMEDRIRATITMHDEEYSKSRFMDIGAGTYQCHKFNSSSFSLEKPER